MSVDDRLMRRFTRIAERRADRTLPQLVVEVVQSASDGDVRTRIERFQERDARMREAVTAPSPASTRPSQGSRRRVSTVYSVIAFALAIAGPIATFPSVRTGGYFFDLAIAAPLAGGVSLVGAALLFAAESPSRRRPPYPAALLLGFAAWSGVSVFYAVRRGFVEDEMLDPAPTMVGLVVLVAAIVVPVLAWVRGRERSNREALGATPRDDMVRWEEFARRDDELLAGVAGIIGGMPTDQRTKLKRDAESGFALLAGRGVLDADEAGEVLAALYRDR